MNLPEAARIAALAQRLALTPRQLLVLAAHTAREDGVLDREVLERATARVRAAADAADEGAQRTLLGPAAYALDDVDQGLLLAWSGVAGLDP